jgi:hypothetical protein
MSFNNRSIRIPLRNTDTQVPVPGNGKSTVITTRLREARGNNGGGEVPGEPGVDSSETDDRHGQQDDQQPRGGRDQILDRKKSRD